MTPAKNSQEMTNPTQIDEAEQRHDIDRRELAEAVLPQPAEVRTSTPIEKKVRTKKITRSTLASPIAAASLPERPASVPSASARAISEGGDEAQDEFREALPDLAQLSPSARRGAD